MPSYLVQVSYTSETLAAFIKHPQDRTEHIRKVAESLGGKLIGLWWAFGDYDTVVIADMPDDLSAAAVAVSVSAGGAAKSLKTTPLLSGADGIAFLQKAKNSVYKPVKA